jgi:hypothetical protein
MSAPADNDVIVDLDAELVGGFENSVGHLDIGA